MSDLAKRNRWSRVNSVFALSSTHSTHKHIPLRILPSCKSGVPIGVLAIVGGFLAHLTLGTLYCWGNFQSYLPPSMKYFAGSDSVGTPDSLYVIPIAMIFMCLGMPMSAFFQARMGLPLSMLFGSLLMSSGVFMSSYATTLAQFILPYCILFGTGERRESSVDIAHLSLKC